MRFQAIDSVLASEPRIVHIRNTLAELLKIVQLEKDGKPLEIDGFRLRDPLQWIVPNQNAPFTLSSHLGRRCNIHCDFCYLDGNPPTLAMAKGRKFISDQEFELRLDCYNTQSGHELFQSHYDLMEVLFHPRALEYLTAIRKRTDRVLNITTAGTLLTSDVIEGLSRLKPLRIWLSLNTVDSDCRRLHLKDLYVETALEAPKKLRDFGISYGISVVPIPQAPLENLIETLSYADRYDPYCIRVIMPSFTKYSPSESWHQNWENLWHQIVRSVRLTRTNLKTPVIIYPCMFEEIHYDSELNGVKVLGVVVNSPAYEAGLRFDMWIRSLDEEKVYSRDETREKLAEAFLKNQTIMIKVEAKGVFSTISINPVTDYRYPFSPELTRYHVHSTPYGIILGGGLRPEYFDSLEDLAREKNAKKVWFVSSSLMKPLVEDMIRRIGFPKDGSRKFKFLVPESHFMGGNVIIGEMMALSDFYFAVTKEMEQAGETPDLIVLPSTPFTISNGWGRDLEGNFYKDLELAINIPVSILPCSEIKF